MIRALPRRGGATAENSTRCSPWFCGIALPPPSPELRPGMVCGGGPLRFDKSSNAPAGPLYPSSGMDIDPSSDLAVDLQRSKLFPKAVLERGQPVLDAFYDAVAACGCTPPLKPTIQVATAPGPIRYDHESYSVVLVPYELLDPPGRAAMDRFAAIGTLGLSGPAQYEEIFHSLLVAHELGHWLQTIAERPLTRWQAEFGANQIMVAFWRGHPASAPAAPTEARLATFVVQPANFPALLPRGVEMSPEDYFNWAFAEIESHPAHYAAFQKFMVRQAMAAQPARRFCELVASTWPPL